MNNKFLKSNCYISDDFGMLNDARQRGLNILCLVEPEESSQYPGCSIASLLLPHPIIITEFLNSDPNQMNYTMVLKKYLFDYQNYLASSELEQSIVNILAALYKVPKHLLLFCPTDQNKEFKILDSIVYFLSNTFGIIPGEYQYIFTDNPAVAPRFIDTPAFRYIILDLLFINGFIDVKEYALTIPPNSIPSPRATSKLLQLVNQPMPDLKSAIITAINIIESVKRENKTGKISPLIETRNNLSQEMENKIDNAIFNSQPNQQQNTQPSSSYLQNIQPNIINNQQQLNNIYEPRQPIVNNQPYTPPPQYINQPNQPMNNNSPWTGQQSQYQPNQPMNNNSPWTGQQNTNPSNYGNRPQQQCNNQIYPQQRITVTPPQIP